MIQGEAGQALQGIAVHPFSMYCKLLGKWTFGENLLDVSLLNGYIVCLVL